MILTFTKNKFNAIGDWSECRDYLLPKNSGWKQVRANRFETTEYKVAAHLRQYADEAAKFKLRSVLIERTPWVGRIPYPKECKPRDFQIPAAKFALERNRSYLALDPGLGKGVIAALICNALADLPVVIVVPPGLALTMEAEISKWCGHEPLGVTIIKDSVIHRPDVRDKIQDLNPLNDGVLIVDEFHRYKNGAARRTKAMLGKRGLYKEFEKVIVMSGTPVPNRPLELYAALSRLAPETIDFANRTEFGQKYCGGYVGEDGRWNFKGASRMQELRKRVHGKFMLRIKKADVLKDLPPKTEELILLDAKLPAKVTAMEKKILRAHSPEDLVQAQLGPGAEHQSSYLRMLGELKVKPALAFLRDFLEDSDEKIIVYAHHKAVVAELFAGLKKFHPLKIVGGMPTLEKQLAVEKFQNKKRHRVMVGNIVACGLGFTLTKATQVFFVEYSWCPKINEQAADRAHRIGQRNNVYVRYMVFANSLDRVVLETDLRKRNVIANI